MHLVAFAEVAHVGDELNRDRVFGDAFGLDVGIAEAFELTLGGKNFVRIRCALPAHQRANVVPADIADVQAEGT